MAHECPDCGSTCYCNGDIDDCELDDPKAVEACVHYQSRECEAYEPEVDDDNIEEDDYPDDTEEK